MAPHSRAKPSDQRSIRQHASARPRRHSGHIAKEVIEQRKGRHVMNGRLKGLGILLALMGIGFIAGGGYAFMKTQEGFTSLNALSAAQNVKLTYNDQGQLVDRGETAGAAAIMSLLRDDWKYPVNASELNPNDP